MEQGPQTVLVPEVSPCLWRCYFNSIAPEAHCGAQEVTAGISKERGAQGPIPPTAKSQLAK